MNQNDEEELGEIARSIASIFQGDDELGSAVTEPSVVPAQSQPDPVASHDVVVDPKADIEPDYVDLGLLMEEEGAGGEPEPPPVEAEVTSLEPEPPPVEVETTPLEPEVPPVEAAVTPVEPEDPPAEAEETPMEPGLPLLEEEETPVAFDPLPVDAEVTTVEAEATSTGPEAPPLEAEDISHEPDLPPVEAEVPSVEPGPPLLDAEDTPVEAEPSPVEAEAVPEPEPTPIEASAEPEPTPTEVSAEPEPTSVSPEAPQTDVGQPLDEATSHYLQASAEEREEAERKVHAMVEEARSAGLLRVIASSVDGLLLQGAGDAHVEALAGELMQEDVVAWMVQGLGRVREEEHRDQLLQAYSKLGDSMARVIADALTTTEDRLARKTYVAALGEFGSVGASAVEEMLQDSRWFVARNGVAVLGAAGGEDTIGLLTESLAHDHSGVRRETVRSLAKIGGENAGLLVSSMLGDSDPEVRAEAARAVSVLKVEKAYKSLIEILKEGDEEGVIEQALRALGALGDASAVPAIAKRISGSLFSKAPTGVRIAGLSALAAIGTPHALKLVEKAKADKDSEVSAAAGQLLAGK